MDIDHESTSSIDEHETVDRKVDDDTNSSTMLMHEVPNYLKTPPSTLANKKLKLPPRF